MASDETVLIAMTRYAPEVYHLPDGGGATLPQCNCRGATEQWCEIPRGHPKLDGRRLCQRCAGEVEQQHDDRDRSLRGMIRAGDVEVSDDG